MCSGCAVSEPQCALPTVGYDSNFISIGRMAVVARAGWLPNWLPSAVTLVNAGDLFRTKGQLSRVAGERSRTPVNGPAFHGMQEVWGSNPHSSTQVKAIKSNVRSHGLGPLYSSKVQQPANRTPVRIQPPRRTGRLAWPANAGTGTSLDRADQEQRSFPPLL